MLDIFEFEAVARNNSGTSAARVIRHNNGVPAILYGGSKDPEILELNHNDVVNHLSEEAVYSHILDVKIDGKKQKVILKAVQRHPSKPRFLHIDFQRINQSKKLRVHVPLHFLNEETAVGVKAGGIVTHNMVDIEVTCLPKNLPEFIELDLTDLNVGELIHLSDIQLPKGVDSVILGQGEDHDLPVVSIAVKRTGSEESEQEKSDESDEE